MKTSLNPAGLPQGRAPRPRGVLAALWLVLLCAALVFPAPAGADRRSRETPVVRVVRRAAPWVVNISTTTRERVRLFRSGDPFFDRFFEDFFGPQQRETHSLGSGVIIDGRRGLIATNSHVVRRASEITVQLADRRRFRARLVGADADSDLAVLKIRSREPLPQARLGDSDQIMIGETVIAIGNPFGLSHTVTVGVVSALNRRVRGGEDLWLNGLIQTDASINPGNSGGPLLNTDGEVIGINSAIYRKAQGIGFAIPINRVKRVVRDLVRYGEVIPTWVGLDLQDLSPRLAAYFGLRRPRGALVLGVMKGSPAQAAGFKRGDLILEVDGTPLEGVDHYRSWLAGLPAGKTVKFGVLTGRRGARERMVTRRVKTSAFPLGRAAEVAWRRWGLAVADLDRRSARMHGVRPRSAVVITRLRRGSQAARIGLRPGDLIRRVGERPTPDRKSFLRQIAKYRLKHSLGILVQRGPASQFIVLGR